MAVRLASRGDLGILLGISHIEPFSSYHKRQRDASFATSVITKAADLALSVVLFSAEEQEEEYIKTIARWGMGSGMPHDLYFFSLLFC